MISCRNNIVQEEYSPKKVNSLIRWDTIFLLKQDPNYVVNDYILDTALLPNSLSKK